MVDTLKVISEQGNVKALKFRDQNTSAYTQTYSTGDKTIANATVGDDIATFTDPPAAAEMALLKTFVNALKADNVDLRQAITSIIDDLQALELVT